MWLMLWPLTLLNLRVTLLKPGPPLRILAEAPLPFVFWSSDWSKLMRCHAETLKVCSTITTFIQEEFLKTPCRNTSLSPGTLLPTIRWFDLLVACWSMAPLAGTVLIVSRTAIRKARPIMYFCADILAYSALENRVNTVGYSATRVLSTQRTFGA